MKRAVFRKGQLSYWAAKTALADGKIKASKEFGAQLLSNENYFLDDFKKNWLKDSNGKSQNSLKDTISSFMIVDAV